MKTKAKITRKDTREHLAQFHLACELVKVIHHYFPGLLSPLKNLEDPRDQRYITYESHVLLMTRILSSIFYISSMRKTSQEFNSDTVIENIGYLCGRPELPELPYWERINDYLKRLDPSQLQGVVCGLVRRLLRSRVFEGSRIRGKYWQVIVDGTQLESSRRELDPKSLYRIHRKGTPEEYREYYYYVLEAKLVLRNDILVSIMTEFVEHEGSEVEKQDCERKACRRLLKKQHGEFPRLPVCLSADSLYACEPFFEECRGYGYHYILRFKEGSIPYVADEFGTLRNREGNLQKEETEEMTLWSDYVNGIDYEGHLVNLLEYREEKKKKNGKGKEKRFLFLTDLAVTKKNVRATAEAGSRRWKIENEGFNTQKNYGYCLEHMYSRVYQGIKNHYYLIQIGHMIAQVMEAWESLWKKVRQSREQKHRRILESWKQDKLKETMQEIEQGFQIRFG